jgi:nitroreductase
MKRLELSRRALTAGGIGILATAVTGRTRASAADRQPSALPDDGGVRPWDYWLSNGGTGVVRIASAAILAASPYNTQPWLFRLTDNQIEILVNSDRNVGGLDPLRRELYMGLGCAVENACVAAPSQGLVASVSLVPDPTRPDLAAVLDLQTAVAARDPHHDAIGLRHTHRGAYRLDRPVELAVLDALAQQASSPDTRVVFLDAASPEGKLFADLTNEATEIILSVSELREGRHAGLRDALANASGDIDEALKRADAAWLEATRTVSCATAAAFGLIMVRGARSSHAMHMEAGRLWQRIHLDGTMRGLAMQPMNHLIELIDYEAAKQGRPSVLARMRLPNDWKGWEPIFGFRLGYADAPAPRSTRRPLSSVVVS